MIGRRIWTFALIGVLSAALVSGTATAARSPREIATVATAGVSTAAAPKPPKKPAPEFVRGHVLMGMKAGTSTADMRRAAERASAKPEKTYGTKAHLLSVAKGTEKATVAKLRKDPNVRYAELDFVYHLQVQPDDPSYPSLWGLENTGQTVDGVAGTPDADIDAETAWTISTGSSAVVVGVVDTGIDYNHPDLALNMWSNPGGVGGCPAGTHGYDAVNGDCQPLDDHNHGSHTSGTIGAVGNNDLGVTGINWTTRLMALKAFNASGATTTTSILDSLNFAIAAKQAGVNLRVLNNSWGGFDSSQATLDAIRVLGANDVLFVAAAGNYGIPNDLLHFYPCDYDADNIVCVGASDQTDKLASFSNYGTTVDLAAPGVNILSTVRGGGYQVMDGTSMATPHVTGAAALVLAAGDRSTSEVKAQLLASVDVISALAGKVATGGRLDLGKAVVPPSPLPGAPILTATAGATSVHLSWSVPAAGASPISEYRVYRAAGADPEVSLATVMAPATSFDDAAVVAGVTYRYRVTAVNGDGEGPFSSEAAAALPMAPSAPALTGVPDDGAAHLCWTAPVDGGSAITGYRLYRAVVGDPLALRADLPTTPLQYEDGGVTNGVTYAYAVSATNAVGEGPASATVQVRPSATGTAPTITSVAPSIGSPGDAITIQGTNFASGACLEVTFDTRPATVTSANATTVVAPVPNAGGSGHITVATPSGQAASAGDFFAVPPPSTPALVEVAGRIVFGTPLTTSISTSGKIGLLLFDGSSGQRISLNISNSTISSSNISVLKPDGSTLATKRVAPNGFIDVQTLPTTGTYVVLVDPETTKTGSLKLTLYDVPADATGTITAGGPSVTLTTTTPGQNGALTFTGTAGQRVSLNITDSTITVTNLAILDPDGSTLGTKRAAPNGFMDVETLPVTGTYRITLNPESTYTGSLKLTLYDVPADASGTITAGGSSVTLTTTTPGQNGALTFAGVSNQRISLNITNSTIPVTNVSILKPDGKSLASSRADPNGFLDVQTLPVTGTYRITLNPESTYAGSLTLTLYDVPADASGTITAGGPAVTVTTTTPGQNGALTFAGTTGQRITLNITNSTIPVTNISILKPDGKSLATKRADPNGFLDVQTLPATGTYRITLNPESTKTGSLTLTLYDVPADASGTITAGGPSVTVTIATPGQNGAFTFTGTAGQRITLNITNSTIPVTNVAVLKPDGSTLATKRASPNGVIDALTLPVTGTYRITLNPESTYTGSLTLTLQ